MSATAPEYARATSDGSEVAVWVVPGSSRTEISGTHAGALRVRVAVPPEGGRANQAVAGLLRGAIGADRIELVRGARSRRKVFAIPGVSPSQIGRRLDL